MLGSVVQVHLSPPTEFSVLPNNKHLYLHRCFFVWRYSTFDNLAFIVLNVRHDLQHILFGKFVSVQGVR